MLDQILELFKAPLQNEFAAGGITIVAFTALLALARNLPLKIWFWIKRRFVTIVDVSDHDPAFFWIQRWLSEHEYTRTKARWLTASTRTKVVHEGSGTSKIAEEHPSGEECEEVEIMFSPAPGMHLLWFHKHLVLLQRARREVEGISGNKSYHETFTFSTFSRETVKAIIREARAIAFPPEEKSVAIHREGYGNWRSVMKRPPRDVNSVILPEGLSEELLQDMREFLGDQKWYTDHGIPYQRGYLFEGPPGNGKTSMVIVLASLFGRDIYIARPSLTTDDSFQDAMTNVPEHGIVLIEDVDALFSDRKKEDNMNFLTFSGFINAIDGIAAPQGRILIMTTNHKDKLDAALIRPGRVDRKFHFPNADEGQARRLFLRFFEHEFKAADIFSKAVHRCAEPLSMSQLQEHIINNKDDVEKAKQL